MTAEQIELARRLFDIAPSAVVPPVCLSIVADLDVARWTVATATRYGDRRDAEDRVQKLERKIHDMMTSPAPRCPCCGRPR